MKFQDLCCSTSCFPILRW